MLSVDHVVAFVSISEKESLINMPFGSEWQVVELEVMAKKPQYACEQTYKLVHTFVF